MRYYRTPVRIFYVVPTSWLLILAGGTVGTMVLLPFTHSLSNSLMGGFCATIALLVACGRTWAWSSSIALGGVDWELDPSVQSGSGVMDLLGPEGRAAVWPTGRTSAASPSVWQ